MKKYLVIFITALIFSSVVSADERDIKILINSSGTEITDAYMDIQANRVMVPVREICEKLGAEVEYLPANASRASGFIVKNEYNSIRMFEDNSRAYIMKGSEMESVDIGTKVQNLKDINYVPIRFIAETLGYSVEWKSEDKFDSINIWKNMGKEH